MLPINRIVNCERMIATGEYQLAGTKFASKTTEEMWLIKYYLEQGKTKQEIYELISQIHEKAFGHLEYRTFNGMFYRAKTCNIHMFSEPIMIYEDELYYINHLPFTLTQKQFVFCILCLFKSTNNTPCEYSDFSNSAMMSFVRKHRWEEKYDRGNIVFYLEKDGFLINDQRNGDKYNGHLSVNRKYFQNYEDRDLAFVLASLIDVQNVPGAIRNMYICEQCGVEFERSPRCKRQTCDKCRKVERKHDLLINDKRYHIRKREKRRKNDV